MRGLDAQDGSRTVQAGYRGRQDGTRGSRDGPRWTQDGPRRFKSAPRRLHESSQASPKKPESLMLLNVPPRYHSNFAIPSAQENARSLPDGSTAVQEGIKITQGILKTFMFVGGEYCFATARRAVRGNVV